MPIHIESGTVQTVVGLSDFPPVPDGTLDARDRIRMLTVGLAWSTDDDGGGIPPTDTSVVILTAVVA